MLSSEIKDYWNRRARKSEATATTNDYYLRFLESRILADEIASLRPKRILDIGCGDAETTIRLASKFPQISFVGLDYAENMIEIAARNIEVERYKGNKLDNLRLVEGDFICDHDSYLENIDLCISCRWLINLSTREDQLMALDKIKTPIRFIENFLVPHMHLNDLRGQLGLDEIPIANHNVYLDSKRINAISFADTYYFATRIIYAAECMVKKIKPDYMDYRHSIAIHLPNISDLCCAPMRMIKS